MLIYAVSDTLACDDRDDPPNARYDPQGTAPW